MLGKRDDPRRRRRFPLVLALSLAAAVLAVTSLVLVDGLVAEPYFTVREGYKCSKCHVNRTGGGKRTDYAQVYMNTRMSMSAGAQRNSEGAVGTDMPSGRLSEHFSVSADLRQSATWQHPDGSEATWQFGRENACESCHSSTDGGGKLAEFYFQAEAIPGVASVVLSENLQPTVSGRELYGLLETQTLNGYLKAGTFKLPNGLQNTFDDPWIHGTVNGGYSGLVGLETVRGDGVEIGIEPGPFSVSFSMTNPADTSAVPRDKRVHLNAYAVGGLGLVGLSTYHDPIKDTLERDYTAVYGGTSLGRFTAMLEVDQFTDSDPTGSAETKMQAGMAQVDFLISRGQNVKWQYEFFDPDTETSNNIRDRNSFIYEPFVTPYLQLRTGVRILAGPKTESGTNGRSAFVEVHLIY